MEEAVHDAILTGTTTDPALAILIEVTITSISEQRPIFFEPLNEPLMYRRYFKRWVADSLDELAKIEQTQRQIDPV